MCNLLLLLQVCGLLIILHLVCLKYWWVVNFSTCVRYIIT
jgi:hypothetical protein